MLARLAGRLVTGPVAFLAAGVLDVALYWAAALRRRVAAGRRSD